ncbi:LOW QUALITY PROTEIN: hypothetical protein HID58_064770 [Brassica napus]|uniref:RRM domain-containing protein n=1 Tax=Brassica napus TaxID=3708 RepID=A0ABQ7ZAZ0_BRANA|nr:LOW QUALITY PROTEIN: hypothetical protein HID58_064770 [Brassica napus]
MAAQQAMQKNTLYVGGLADEVNESILHAAFIPFGDIKDVKTPLDQANQKHRSFGFVTFLEREDASAAMDNMDGAELYGRVLTVNYALPEKIKGGEQGWAAHPLWADADTWFERQQQEKEILKIQAENKAAMEAAEELHRKKLAQDRQGEMEEDTDVKDDPMARAEAEALSHDNPQRAGRDKELSCNGKSSIAKWIALDLDAPVATIATLAAELMTGKVRNPIVFHLEWSHSSLFHHPSDGELCSVAALSTDTLSLMEYICLGNTLT